MHRISIVVAIAMLLAACSGKQPGEADIRQQFELTELPGLVELKAFTMEQRRNTGSDEHPVWLARYTAQITLREDTYELDTVEGDVRLLKPLRRAGEAFPLYGLVRSERAGDGWRHSFQRDGSSNPLLGRPRGDYGPDALVVGSPEATALLAEIERQRDQERIAAETARAAEEAERRRAEQAESDKRRRIEEAFARHDASYAPETVRELNLAEGRKMNLMITASADGSGKVWGTDQYAVGSNLAKAVVHAGVLKPGETGVIQITRIPEPSRYRGSPRNGIDSESYVRQYALRSPNDDAFYQGFTIRLLEHLDNADTHSETP